MMRTHCPECETKLEPRTYKNPEWSMPIRVCPKCKVAYDGHATDAQEEDK